MEKPILSIISLLVLGIIMYFLPLGFSKKGKIVLVGVSFILANLANLSMYTLPLWETALSIILLIFLFSYLVDKKWAKVLYSAASVDEEIVEEPSDQEKVVVAKELEKQNKISVSEIIPGETLLVKDELDEAEVLDVQVEMEELEDLEEIIVPIAAEKVESEDILLTPNQTNVEDDIDFLNDREIVDIENVAVADTKEELQSVGYMSEIEKLLLEDEDDLVDHHDEQPSTIEDISLIEHDNLEEMEEQMEEIVLEPLEEELILEDVTIDEYSESEYLKEEEELVESSNSLEELIISTTMLEELTMEEKDIVDEVLTGMEDFVINEELNMALQQAAVAEEDIKDQNNQNSDIQLQLFHNMIAQIRLSSTYLSAEEYEKSIREYMGLDLSLQEYYTFSSLLIEHYIDSKQMGKLKELLHDLKGRFVNYPILEMEIQFLFEQYCE